MTSQEIIPDITLDCSGQRCPLPVIETSKAIKRLKIGQVLKVVSTDSGSPADMDAWARQSGHAMLDSLQENGNYIFYFCRVK